MMQGNSSNASNCLPTLRWASTLDFESTFDEAKSQALDTIRQWYPRRQTQELDLSAVEACVVIRNHERAVVHDNPAYQLFFSRVSSATGKVPDARYRTSKLSQNTDELIAEGIRSLECEHDGKDATGQAYSFRTFKCQLGELRDPNYFIFSLSRPIAYLGNPARDPNKSLLDLFAIFQSLDATDQLTCRLDAKGESTREISTAVGLCSRAIEIRRKKMFELFDVQRPMELVRITIRLEEHGLLPT